MRHLSLTVSLAAPLALFPVAFGQSCVTPPANEYRYANPATVYYSLDPSLGNIPLGSGAGAGPSAQTQIAAAIAAWNSAAVGVTFAPGTTSNPATLKIQASLTVSGTGDAASTTAPAGVIPPTTNVTITFNPNNTFKGTSSYLFSATSAGYSTVYEEVALHELGHTLGLNDVDNDNPPNSNFIASSVEEQGEGVNLDSYQLPRLQHPATGLQ